MIGRIDGKDDVKLAGERRDCGACRCSSGSTHRKRAKKDLHEPLSFPGWEIDSVLKRCLPVFEIGAVVIGRLIFEGLDPAVLKTELVDPVENPGEFGFPEGPLEQGRIFSRPGAWGGIETSRSDRPEAIVRSGSNSRYREGRRDRWVTRAGG